MKILCLVLNNESVSTKPSRYGGAGRTAALLRKYLPDFYVAGEASCFEDYQDKPERNIVLSKEQVLSLRMRGVLVDSIIDTTNFDLIFTHDTGVFQTSSKPILVWSVGYQEQISSGIKHLLLHNRRQDPVLNSDDVQVHDFVLGVELPEFQVYQKQDYIFQCSNHYPQIHSLEVAQICNHNNIKCIFAGPVAENYKYFLNEIDNINTFYLGEIKEEQKIELLKGANFVTSILSHNLNEVQLAVKEGWSYGAGLISNGAGALGDVLIDGVNGFRVNNGGDFVQAWNSRRSIVQENCYKSAENYKVSLMVDSFTKVCQKILS